MASEPQKQPNLKRPTPAAPAIPPQEVPPQVPKAPPLFRRIDWIGFVITSILVFAGYLYTLAPDLTLEDSGELAVGSYYAGVPHPPGYPVWTIYTWLFTKLIPFSNIAWRVGVSSAFASALACGLISLMVSRGSSMFIESVAELKNLDRRVENWICLASGFVASLLLAFNGFMWSQSVIVEVYSLSMLSLTGVLVCLLHWSYAPHQYRYLYLAWFLCGICFNNHQSLLVIVLAMELLMVLVQPKIGRAMLFWNGVGFILGLILSGKGDLSLLSGNTPVLVVFTLVGVGSIIGWLWLSIKTRASAADIARDIILALTCIGLVAFKGLTGMAIGLSLVLLVFLGLDIYYASEKRPLPWMPHWRKAFATGLAFLFGAAFYLYMPLASMTNPPMNWGYPRTVGGFIHAFTRGQYERIHPTAGVGRNIAEQTVSFISTYSKQVKFILIDGPILEFSLGYLLLAFIPLLFFRKLQPRERAWLLGLVAFYIVLGPFLLQLFNPAPDRQSLSLNKPFFIASHVIIAIGIGYGLTLLLASLATAYEKILAPVLVLLTGLCLLSVYNVFKTYLTSPYIKLSLVAALGLLLSILALGLVVMAYTKASALTSTAYQKVRLAVLALLIGLLGLSAYDVTDTFLSTPYFVARLTVISGLIIVLLAIVIVAIGRTKALMMPLVAVCAFMPIYSIFGHWSENEQRGHYFGYWFGHDMFTPPFKGKDGKLIYTRAAREELLKTPEGKKNIYPEMTRDAILFGGTDPGRFCPTYMIFDESFIPAKDKPRDPEFDRRDVYIITQNALADGTYLQYIRAHYNRSTEPDVPFFSVLFRSEKERDLNFKTNLFARLFAVPLDNFFLKNGARIEAERRARGVYPPVEIHTPSNEDSQRCFSEYMADAQARMAKGALRPGEDVKVVDNRVQVSGQVAVMAINALLARVIFDKNPTNEFFVEESFPLEWMYPHLTPFGVIMKINREPLAELSREIVDKDHLFWSEFSERLIGNWITYDTPVSNITQFAERVYVNKDFKDFKGDPRFVRDDDGQKAFSKLRSSIAGVYGWRINQMAGQVMQLEMRPPNTLTPQERHILEVHQRMFREADFAFKQAYAFCPYSPEALYRYVQLLAGARRFDDALLLAKTSIKVDPNNAGLINLVSELNRLKIQAGGVPVAAGAPDATAQKLEATYRANPGDFSNAMSLAQFYASQGRTGEVLRIADDLVANPQSDATMVSFAAQVYQQLANYPKLETALKRWTALTPTPEAWLDYAASQAVQNKQKEAVATLLQALNLNKARLKTDSKAVNITPTIEGDARFSSLKGNADFRQLLATNK